MNQDISKRRVETKRAKPEPEASRLDNAARAGWLYYIAGNSQDEIAQKLRVSRQTAQRLIALSVSEKLIKVRLDHPIAHCLDLSQRLKQRFGLGLCEVVPSDPDSAAGNPGIAQAAAAELERWFESPHSLIVAVGSGRTMRATVDQLASMDCPQHKIVSLVGNIAPDGSASFYDVVVRMSDAVRAPHYPMPLPVIATTIHEKNLLLGQKAINNVVDLARQADATFVGIGHLGETGPLLQDGFVSRDEMRALAKAGAVGEIVGWAFDAEGALIDGLTNDRVTSVRLDRAPARPVIAVVLGDAKIAAVRGALRGQLINGLITDELMAEHLLAPA
jgi:DNA-binding transcriptional regulator LsrR (DeoR family)